MSSGGDSSAREVESTTTPEELEEKARDATVEFLKLIDERAVTAAGMLVEEVLGDVIFERQLPFLRFDPDRPDRAASPAKQIIAEAAERVRTKLADRLDREREEL